MAKRGYTGRVLVASARGGYKYVPVGSVDKRLWEPVRRTIKVGRGKARRRRFWVKKETIPVEYVRTFVFRISDSDDYFGVDVVEVVNEPYDITDEQISANLVDPARVRRMEALLKSQPFGLPDDIRYTAPIDAETFMGKRTGGARRLLSGVVGLRWEDLRRVRSGG